MKNKTILFILAATIIVFGAAYMFDRGFQNIVQIKQSEIVDLKDGDTYDLAAAYVTKEIGGKRQTMLAYNGSIPGPTIRVAQGAEITVNFKNDTDLPALLHSHGVRMDNAFDGSQLVQKEMKPGNHLRINSNSRTQEYIGITRTQKRFLNSRSVFMARLLLPQMTSRISLRSTARFHFFSLICRLKMALSRLVKKRAEVYLWGITAM